MSTMVNAVVLAGGSMEESLRPLAAVNHKAWIPLGGRAMVERVLDALDGCRQFVAERILVANPSDIPDTVKRRVDAVAPPGQSPLLSWESGVARLRDRSLPVMGIPCDMCMLEPSSILDFLERCQRRPADIHYSFVRRETSEARYPGLRHTWVRLREGTFCGGGLAIMKVEAIARARAFIEDLTVMRKQPWRLASLLGPKIIFKLLLRRLTVAEAEERISLLMKSNVVGIESPFPDVGFNVDAPEELATARRLVEAGCMPGS